MATTDQVDQPRHATDAKAFVDSVYEGMMERAQAKIGNGRFMRALAGGSLPFETVRLFWLNWHGYVSVVNNFIQCTYHTHYPFFLRYARDLLPTFADKVADEITHPEPPGHMLMVWKQGEVFGLTREQMIEYEMLPGCRAYADYRRGLYHEGTMAEWWASIATELYIGHWSRAFREALVRHYNFTDERLPFFTTHEKADLEIHEGGILPHGLFNRMVLTRLIATGHDQTRPGYSIRYCATTAVDLLALFLETCYQEGVNPPVL